VEHAADSILIVDAEGKILYLNPAFEQLTGYGAHELLGKNVSMLRSGRLSDAFYAQMERTVRSGKVFRAIFVSRRKDGSLFSEDKAITPIADAEGKITHFVGTGRDVSESLKAHDLELKLKAAEEAERLKTGLLSTVSHELRTPLSAILSYTTAILDYGPSLGPTRTNEYLWHIEDRARQLDRLIGDLLTMSQVESGNLPLEPETASLQEVVSDALADWALRDGLSIENHLPRRPFMVRVDAGRIREVLHNLLENSHKYASGSARVKVSARRRASKVQVTVRDYGVGVAVEDLDAIFERFYRGPRGHDRGGAGLGLAICKAIVESHGGQIRASLPEGGGLAISFTLPAEVI
jgi:PAS domain S-box-containing protein